ncbi:MAG TPA: FAD-dependent thymidylate synthase [Anaerolineae bacterium]|nr:FAD-dependent thymidylate synthase [Anaerolineae bacterium]
MLSKRNIYLLDSKKLSPETIAVIFAKTSRSPNTFHEIAAELTDEKSSEFHQKWVLEFGHASVAEHAILHIAIENISRLAVETLESNRLASYTEKSSRYQVWDATSFYVPAELKRHPLEKLYRATCQMLFRAYQEALPILKETARQEMNRRTSESDKGWQRRVHTNCMDVCRYYLPAASLANVGVTINARALVNALRKMLSHPLLEVREMGEEIKSIAQCKLPTLVKYADENTCLKRVRIFMTQINRTKNIDQQQGKDWCHVIHFDAEYEERIFVALLYRFNEMSYAQSQSAMEQFSFEQKQGIVKNLLENCGEHDVPLRELEHSWLTFDILLDQGAYFEFKRHRMMTQTPQRLTARLGYAIPKLIHTAGLEKQYRRVMDEVQEVYEEFFTFNPDIAAYIVPNGFNRRVLATLNFRTAMHLIKLRSAPNAHFAMRRVACRIAEEVCQRSSLFKKYLTTCSEETWQEIENMYFVQI